MERRSFRYDWTRGKTPAEAFDYDWETIKFEKDGIYINVIQAKKSESVSILEGAIEIQNKANRMKFKNPSLKP